MKRFATILLLCTTLTALSQPYNNEWINYSQPYYKFKIGATGLYRITQPVLSGLGIGSTPTERFQLWRNGKEIPLYTTIATGAMGPADYIEFWGEANDGQPDAELYPVANHHLNTKWSLQTDTAAFFLTITTTGTNKRLVPTANALPSALAPEPFFIHTAAKYYKEKMNRGFADANAGTYLYSSSYDKGEGWTSNDIAGGGTRSEAFNNLFAYTGAGATAPSLQINAVGVAPNTRQFEVKLNGTVVQVQTMDYFEYARITIPITTAQISGATNNIDIKNLSAVSTDRMDIAQTTITYPRQFNFGGADNFSFSLPASAAGNYLEITGFNYGAANPVLYDMTNGKRYIAATTSTPVPTARIHLEPSATVRQLLLVSQAAGFPKEVTTIQAKNFINYALPANQGNYLIISHPALMSGAGGANPVEDYRAYRSSATGGAHAARIYLSDELVDQFGFGVKKNPAGIRNFIRWARANYSQPVKNIFLIGHGMNYINYRVFETSPGVDALNLVPTFGEPASDNMLAANSLADASPAIAIGRLSVINAAEVQIYLQKMIQYEQHQASLSPVIADKAWSKNVVHVVGASDGFLAVFLSNAVSNYKNIIGDTLYGANVATYSKASSAPVEQANSAGLYRLYEEGLGLMTYFGHSSATTLEFNLDNPENYNNPGKYPVSIVLGCNAGNFYTYNPLRLTQKETMSEKFVLADNRGSIAFIASTHFGIPSYLDLLNSHTYRSASVSLYGQSMGDIMKASVQQLFQDNPNDYYARIHSEQTTIHGDPALRLNGNAAKPDYAIEDQYLKINPSFISVAENRFSVKAKFFNLGKAPDRDIVVELKRTFPDLSTMVIRRDTIPGIRFIDSLSYDIDIVPLRDKGLNKISICLDADNTANEIFETNNCITKEIFIYEDEARPVYPYAFSIINKQNIKLVASTANPFSTMKQYTMEMDTTELFNSPLKITRSLSSTGGVLEFTPGITFTDSTVYYWRVSPVPVSGPPVWNNASFVYLNPGTFGSTDVGYNQSHYYQHTRSATERMTYSAVSRQWSFDKPIQNLKINLGTWNVAGVSQYNDLCVFFNDVPRIRLFCKPSTLQFNVIDPVSFYPWLNQFVSPGQGLYGSGEIFCDPDETRIHSFEYPYADTSNRRKMMDFMRDIVPNGHYVIVRNFTYPINTGAPIAWAEDWRADENHLGTGQSIYHYLKNAGFTGIDSFYKVRPWALVYKKNDPSFTPRWLVGNDSAHRPTMSIDIPITDTVAYLTSPVFGPARAWKQLIWRGTGDAIGDTATVDLIGVRSNGTEQTLFTGLTTAQQNVNVSSINAAEYPFVKLKLRTADRRNLTPYQLRYWRLTYDPVPEGAIAPNLFLSAKDTVEVGEPLDYKIAFKNISDAPFDSLKIKMVITDRNNVPHIIPLSKRRPLLTSSSAPADTLHIGALVNTTTLAGNNMLFLEANPDNDQLEQHHFNNFAYRSLYVRPDSLDPLLDVTFDGVHILNRDIVSAKPDILIKLKDEARWMVLNDTSLLTLQVRYPNGSLRRFYFNSDTVQFTPAGQAPNTDNTATINFKPWFTQDGEYQLIVTGKDRSENAAGAIEYKVIFEVINKPMISNMLNYPNPFTTSTAFVFTVTGSEVPQNIKIEIMTITGKVVREITKDELGPLHIGRNITEFKWDGTDQYGSKLANGIYLYRVVTNLDGKALDKYRSQGENTDKYFIRGYGKMYLMR